MTLGFACRVGCGKVASDFMKLQNNQLFRSIFPRLLLSMILIGFGLVRCASKEVGSDSPDALFAVADEEFKDEHYLSAMEKFRDIKNRFPYSSRAVEAELRIADTHFAQENFIEAESSYEVFRELHPTHPKSDYVQYQIGMSNFHQIPANAARDLTAAQKTIDAFDVLVEKFKSSTYVEKAKENRALARSRLAEHESYVADFYFQKQHYLSASYRYAALLNDFAQMGYDEMALYRLGKCYAEIRMFAKSRDILGKLVKEFPASEYKVSAEQLLAELQQLKD